MALEAPYDKLVGADSDGNLPPIIMKHFNTETVMDEPAAALIAAALDLEHPVSIGVAGDSTGNDANDWPKVLMMQLRNDYPNARFLYDSWDSTNKVYRATEVMQAGQGEATSGGLVLVDNFNRSGYVTGSVADSGQTWGGPANIGTLDGSGARFDATGSATMPVGSKDGKLTVDVDVVTTKSSTLAPNIRMAIGQGTSTIWLQFMVSTAGVAFAYLYLNGTMITSQSMATILTTDSATVQRATVSLELAIQNITVTVTSTQGTVTFKGTITESDYANLGKSVAIGTSAATSTAFKVDKIQMETPVITKPLPQIYMTNSCIGGGDFQTQIDILSTLYPTSKKFDVLMVGMGHNYAASDATVQIVAFEKFLKAYRALHPESTIFVYSQNPEGTTYVNYYPHMDRQYAMRRYAQKRGWSYAGVMEAFRKRPDKGDSLVSSDGVHPTTPAISAFTGDFGAVLWADTIRSEIYKNRR